MDNMTNKRFEMNEDVYDFIDYLPKVKLVLAWKHTGTDCIHSVGIPITEIPEKVLVDLGISTPLFPKSELIKNDTLIPSEDSEGQDRESYSDTQDRESYTPDTQRTENSEIKELPQIIVTCCKCSKKFSMIKAGVIQRAKQKNISVEAYTAGYECPTCTPRRGRKPKAV